MISAMRTRSARCSQHRGTDCAGSRTSSLPNDPRMTTLIDKLARFTTNDVLASKILPTVAQADELAEDCVNLID